MTEPEHDEPSPAVGEATTYVRVTPSPVTVRKGQGTGDRAGDRAEGEAPGEVPRADASRGARARGRSVADHWANTLRGTASAGGRITSGARTVARSGLTDVRMMWDYLRDETWMHGSDNTVLRIAGHLWAIVVAIPVTAATRLVQAVVVLVADVVAAVASRFGMSLAAAAIIAAAWFTWPHHQPTPPTAATEVITPASAS